MILAQRTRSGAVTTAVAGVVAALAGAVVAGSAGLLAGLVGTVLVLLFFAGGTLPLALTDGRDGRAGLGFVVLGLTYALRLVLAVAVLSVATASGHVDRRVMGLTVIGCALVWTATQVVLGVGRRTQPGLDL